MVPKAFVQPRLPGLVTQPTKDFQSVCPTKASKTSNSAQAVIWLLERLSNQGFYELITQPKLRKHENQLKQNNENKPTITMVIQEMATLGNPLSFPTILHANDRS